MIFVTGAGGLLGRHLVRRLVASGERVRVLLRRPSADLAELPLETAIGGLSDASALAAGMAGCSRVFHVAGAVSYAPRDSERLYATNVVGTRNVLRAALDAGVSRVVHTSSTAAVGLSDGPIVIEESEPFQARFQKVPYMWTKHLAEVEVADAVASGLDVVTVNPSTLLGAGDVHLHAGQVFVQIERGAVRAAPPGGNSFVSVRDAVEGHLLAMERGRTGRRYILSTGNLTHREWLSGIARAIGRPGIARELPPRAEAPLTAAAALASALGFARLPPAVVFFSFRHRWFSADRAREELGWVPALSFERAVGEAAAWYREAGVLPRREPPPPSDRTALDQRRSLA